MGRYDGKPNGIFSTPGNTLGIGNPGFPVSSTCYDSRRNNGKGIGNTGSDFHNQKYKIGSGDKI